MVKAFVIVLLQGDCAKTFIFIFFIRIHSCYRQIQVRQVRVAKLSSHKIRNEALVYFQLVSIYVVL